MKCRRPVAVLLILAEAACLMVPGWCAVAVEALAFIALQVLRIPALKA